ncbi:NAD(P)-binding domain-containing protein, partial [Pseudomonas aeruginosa]|uniref:NAD(P)-binding domain-containing protein n=1 Tax=Pseudomonas aeruginosa TaxID=287 RepID=UPI0034E0AF22
MTDIAFLGLGNMGGPMAANLLKAGHRVNVFDLQPKAVLSLVEQGAQGADSALQCCEGAEVVISMLPAGQHVESLYLGDDGLLARVAGKPLLIDCSTIVTPWERLSTARCNRCDFCASACSRRAVSLSLISVT